MNGVRTLVNAAMMAGVLLLGLPTSGEEVPPQQRGITVEGVARNSTAEPVVGALVVLKEKDRAASTETRTDAAGKFEFSVPHAGAYTVTAEKPGLGKSVVGSLMLSAGDKKHLELVLGRLQQPSAGTMDFDDKPNFTVAGVTDWTNVGGHGADTTLRASEALTKETLTLKSSAPKQVNASRTGVSAQLEQELRSALAREPNSFEANHRLGEYCFTSTHYREAIPLLETAYRIDPTDHANAYDLVLAYRATGDLERARAQARKLPGSGDVHRLLADLDERLGDPLAAVREYEQAVRMDPSEQNYFEWGSELLLHRAIQPAAEVFTRGNVAHPESARMLAGLGVALYASGSYEEAARRLCDASDLKPGDSTAYLFLGKMEKASTAPLACSEQKLMRFAHDQPQNALANYYYAMSLWKRERRSQSTTALQQVEALLEKAVAMDPKFEEAYLQLGILYSAEGRAEPAIRAYQEAIELSPQFGEAHYRLGLEYRRAGEEARAAREFLLHEQAEKAEAAAIETERRDLRQFVITLRDQPAGVR